MARAASKLQGSVVWRACNPCLPVRGPTPSPLCSATSGSTPRCCAALLSCRNAAGWPGLALPSATSWECAHVPTILALPALRAAERLKWRRTGAARPGLGPGPGLGPPGRGTPGLGEARRRRHLGAHQSGPKKAEIGNSPPKKLGRGRRKHVARMMNWNSFRFHLLVLVHAENVFLADKKKM